MEAITAHAHTQMMVTQSRFFTPEFNTAIIDGPLRIYFADRQESEALQIYFEIQESLTQVGVALNALPLDVPNLFLMIYPTPNAFAEVFEEKEAPAQDVFGEHQILGVQGGVIETDLSHRKAISQCVQRAFHSWPSSK